MTVSWIFVGLLSFSFCYALETWNFTLNFDYDKRLQVCNIDKFLKMSTKGDFDKKKMSLGCSHSKSETVCKIGCKVLGEVFETPFTGKLKCSPEGKWTPDTLLLPRCVMEGQEGIPVAEDVISCPDPGVPWRGERTGACCNQGDTLYFNCSEGYTLIGNQTITCLQSGRWTSEKPRCKSYSKCDIRQVTRLRKDVGWGSRTSKNKTVYQVKCEGHDKIFETSSTGEFRCSPEGTWTPAPDTLPRCVKKERVCFRNQFLCADNETCIGMRHRCNKVSDCGDSSDEEGCEDHECPEGERRCRDGTKCVPKSYFCDGTKDCTDGSDEKGCDKCENWGCSHQCEETWKGPQCSCEELFELDPRDKRTCKNKCEKLGCSQTCSETSDGLQCSCYKGFELDQEDKRTCKSCALWGQTCRKREDCCDKKHFCRSLTFKMPGACKRTNW